MNNYAENTQPVPISFGHHGKNYTGTATPIRSSCREGVCYELDVVLNGKPIGTIYCGNDLKWTIKGVTDQDLVDKIGEDILLWYE
jgi:hypothetical protein